MVVFRVFLAIISLRYLQILHQNLLEKETIQALITNHTVSVMCDGQMEGKKPPRTSRRIWLKSIKTRVTAL